MLVSGMIHQALDGKGDIGTTGTPISGHRRGVGINQVRAHVQSGHLINPAHGDREIAGADETAHVGVVSPQVNLVVKAHGQDLALRIQCNRTVQGQGTTVPIAQEHFGSESRPSAKAAGVGVRP